MSEKIAKILIVDDEANMREYLSVALQEEGYEVQTSGDRQEALEQMKMFSFNLAIVDIRIPGISGLEVLHYIKKTEPETMTIMMTGHASLETAVEAL